MGFLSLTKYYSYYNSMQKLILENFRSWLDMYALIFGYKNISMYMLIVGSIFS